MGIALMLRRRRAGRVLASVTTSSISTNRTAAGSVCVAGRITPRETRCTPQRLSPVPCRELVLNPLYLDRDYKGLHRWEVA